MTNYLDRAVDLSVAFGVSTRDVVLVGSSHVRVLSVVDLVINAREDRLPSPGDVGVAYYDDGTERGYGALVTVEVGDCGPYPYPVPPLPFAWRGSPPVRWWVNDPVRGVTAFAVAGCYWTCETCPCGCGWTRVMCYSCGLPAAAVEEAPTCGHGRMRLACHGGDHETGEATARGECARELWHNE